MSKNKKIVFILSIILVIGVIIASLFITPDNKDKKRNDKKSICTNINNEIKNKNNFVIFVTDNLELDGESNDVINEYIDVYDENNTIFNIDFKELDTSCIKEIFEKDNLYNDLNKNRVNTVLGYKNGTIAMTQSNIITYIDLENVLDENGIVKAKEKKETATLNEIKKNIQKDKYILFIITEENKREYYEKILEKVFADYEYDYINYYGEEGKKVYSFIKDDLEVNNVFPKIIYYSKGKILKEVVASEKDEFEDFKKEIEKLS